MNLFQARDFKPMLLGETNKSFNDKNYLFELKFDGHRALIFASPKKIAIYNRHNQDITYLYPELQNIKKLVKTNTIFDGEIIMVENGVPSFSKLQGRAHLKTASKIKTKAFQEPVIFICFDILYQGKDLTRLPLIERKKILDQIGENAYFIKSKYYIEKGRQLFNFAKKHNLEGIVAKKIASGYEINTRSNNWLKIKNWHTEILWAVAYAPQENSLQVHLARLVKGSYIYAGKVLVYPNNNAYQKIIATPKQNYEVINLDLKTKIKPIYKVKIAYIEKTKNGNFRQPLFIAISKK